MCLWLVTLSHVFYRNFFYIFRVLCLLILTLTCLLKIKWCWFIAVHKDKIDHEHLGIWKNPSLFYHNVFMLRMTEVKQGCCYATYQCPIWWVWPLDINKVHLKWRLGSNGSLSCWKEVQQPYYGQSFEPWNSLLLLGHETLLNCAIFSSDLHALEVEG